MIGSMPPTLSAVSIIVPTFREAPNITPLVERTFATTTAAGIDAEMIIVDDDSSDGTEAVVEKLASRFPVCVVVRRGVRGLSGAVLRGFQEANHDRFVVLDADLQHPPEMIPRFVEHLDDPACDFVIATRYRGTGAVAGDWPIGRRLASCLATILARPLVSLSDPMSGFFALRRGTWERAAELNPVGYKIALELLVKCACKNVAEVPIEFASRTAGESKASFREGLRYANHLLRLYWFRRPGLVVAALIVVVVVAGATLAAVVP